MARASGTTVMNCTTCGQPSREGARFCDQCGASLTAASSQFSTTEHDRLPPINVSELFVGRARELAALIACLESAQRGHGQLVTLAGEPGIGKTSLARQLEAEASARGFRVLWARCYEEGQCPPYWLWTQSLRQYAESSDAHELEQDLGAGAPDIAQVLPGLRTAPDLAAPPALDPEQSVLRFYDSLIAFLERSARRQPIVFIFDNAHWSDRSSLRLLEVLASQLHEIRMLVLATYRDDELSRRHPLARTLSEIGKEPWAQQLALKGLSHGEVSQFLRARIGAAAPEWLADAISQRTEGNPLFVAELVRLFEEDGLLEPGAQGEMPLRIPEGVREVIGRRLDRLPDNANRVLRLASVIGREFSVSMVRRLGEGDALTDIEDSLRAAREHGLVEALAGDGECYRFVHVLIQQTLLEELSTADRSQLHGHIASVLEELYGDNVEEHAVELAHHLAESASPDMSRIIRYNTIAGNEALRVHAYDDALMHFQRALDSDPSPEMNRQKADILSALGKAQAGSLPRARLHEAVSTLSRVSEYLLSQGDLSGAAATALLPFYPRWGQPTGQTDLLRTILDHLSPETDEYVRLLSRYGRMLAIEEGDVEAARPALQSSRDLVERSDDKGLRFRVLADIANAQLAEGASPEVIDTVNGALNLAGVDDPLAELDARYSAIQSSFVLGRIDDIERFGAEMLPLAERIRDRFWRSTAYRVRAYRYWLAAEFERARAENDRCLALTPREARDLTIRVAIEYSTGNTSEAERYLDRLTALIDETTASPNLEHVLGALALGVAAYETQNPQHARRAKQAARTALSSGKAGFGLAALMHTALALVALVEGDDDGMRTQYELLAPLEGRGQLFTTMCGDRLLGLLAGSMGDWESAQHHYEDALAFCQRGALRAELGWVNHDLAELLLASGGRQERARASDLLNRALVLARETGMRPLGERCTALVRRLRPADRTVISAPDGLTDREIDVLKLLAAGKTDREIADALTISVRTANNHVARILSKTASANRTEAARYALDKGLDATRN